MAATCRRSRSAQSSGPLESSSRRSIGWTTATDAAASPSGFLPSRWGLLEVSHSNVVLTALKPGQGNAAVLRVYEAAGKAASGVRIKLRARVAAAIEANLLEDSGRRLKIQTDSVQFDLHPFEIKTIKFQLDNSTGHRAAGPA